MFKNQFSNIIHRKFKLFWEFATLDRIEGLQIKVLIYSCFNKKWISYIHTTQTKASWTSVWYSIFCRPFDSVFILHMKWDDQSSPFPTIAIHHMDWKVLWQRVLVSRLSFIFGVWVGSGSWLSWKRSQSPLVFTGDVHWSIPEWPSDTPLKPLQIWICWIPMFFFLHFPNIF